jgi:hypothetical protein
LTIALPILAAVLIGLTAVLTLAFKHNPTRKFIQRSLDPTWARRAKPGHFSAELIAAEERDMYVSSTVMRDGCDVIWDEYDLDPPANITGPHADGTVIWVNTIHVSRFIADILPRIEGRFVLVTGRENISTAGFDIEQVLAHPGLSHWFMENYEHPAHYLETGRVTPLPLGLNYHKLDPASPNQSRDMGLPAPPGVQQLDFKAIRKRIAPIRTRPLKVYCNFHLNMDTFLRHHHAQKRAIARAEAYEALRDKPFVILEPRQAPRHVVWERHAEAVFEASPRGNSIDCHRTWEALLLHSIPIVKSTLLDPLYDGLPVAIVQDWSEVTPERLESWLSDFAPWFDQPPPPQLYSKFWIARFHAYKPTSK